MSFVNPFHRFISYYDPSTNKIKENKNGKNIISLKGVTVLLI